MRHYTASIFIISLALTACNKKAVQTKEDMTPSDRMRPGEYEIQTTYKLIVAKESRISPEESKRINDDAGLADGYAAKYCVTDDDAKDSLKKLTFEAMGDCSAAQPALAGSPAIANGKVNATLSCTDPETPNAIMATTATGTIYREGAKIIYLTDSPSRNYPVGTLKVESSSTSKRIGDC